MRSPALAELRAALRAAADAEDGEFLQGFFRTGAGGYGEGDRFLGVRVPQLRRLARAHRSLPLRDALTLLHSGWHEERLLALLILVAQYERGDAAAREAIYRARIAIMATFGWIRRGVFDPTLTIAGILLHDPHDLIQKAVGWMLRELGNRDRAREEAFLRAHFRSMPRTMLRYAIEKFPEPLRKRYLRGKA